nr:MAG TPA: hypothetical protein [Caudoviricetes sp.]
MQDHLPLIFRSGLGKNLNLFGPVFTLNFCPFKLIISIAI